MKLDEFIGFSVENDGTSRAVIRLVRVTVIHDDEIRGLVMKLDLGKSFFGGVMEIDW
jgi:hypothetical protein